MQFSKSREIFKVSFGRHPDILFSAWFARKSDGCKAETHVIGNCALIDTATSQQCQPLLPLRRPIGPLALFANYRRRQKLLLLLRLRFLQEPNGADEMYGGCSVSLAEHAPLQEAACDKQPPRCRST